MFTFVAMGILDKARASMAMMGLKAKPGRKRTVSDLSRAKSIGILYDASDRDIAERVREWVTELRTAQKNVQALGFVNTKKPEDVPKSKLSLDFFGAKNLSFSLKSADPVVKNFTSKPFDLLFDFNLNGNPVLLQVLADSEAGFIVGGGLKSKPFCDLYFESERLNTSTELNKNEYLSELNILLTNIHKYVTTL